MARVIVAINSIRELKAGDQWAAFFRRVWPYYKKWFLSEGYTARPGYLTSAGKLKEYMPELMPVYERLTSLAGAGDVESRFLSLYCPPPFITGCSQIAWNRGGNYLLRNYDYSPQYFDGVLLYSDWLKPVIGMVDCTWGLLDGMNASGLGASLTFGGRKVTGDGFGIPIVLRYALETCDTVKEAIEVFKRIPIHMSYNVTLVDSTGQFATLYLAPGTKAQVKDYSNCTNHQEAIEWPRYAELTHTVERKEVLDRLATSGEETIDTLLKKFLRRPLYNTLFEKAFGTLYTVRYNLDDRSMELHWPERQLFQSFGNFHAGKTIVYLQQQAKGKLAL